MTQANVIVNFSKLCLSFTFNMNKVAGDHGGGLKDDDNRLLLNIL